MLASKRLQILMAKGPSGPRVGGKQILILPAGDIHKPQSDPLPQQGDRGKGDYKRPLRAGAYRSRPPAAFKVNCPKGARECGLGHCLLCRRGQSRPPRRAELSK